MTSVPEYWNAQSKLVYDINAKNKLTFNLIIGNDNINIEDESRPDLYGAEYVDFKGEQITYGLTYNLYFLQMDIILLLEPQIDLNGLVVFIPKIIV